jgi:hypothetical protein
MSNTLCRTGEVLKQRIYPVSLCQYKDLGTSVQIHIHITIYYTVQGDQKVSVHLMITIQKVTRNFKVSPASLQTFIDTRLKLTPSIIPNSNSVIMVSD